jgi:hypothetical protein
MMRLYSASLIYPRSWGLVLRRLQEPKLGPFSPIVVEISGTNKTTSPKQGARLREFLYGLGSLCKAKSYVLRRILARKVFVAPSLASFAAAAISAGARKGKAKPLAWLKGIFIQWRWRHSVVDRSMASAEEPVQMWLFIIGAYARKLQRIV